MNLWDKENGLLLVIIEGQPVIFRNATIVNLSATRNRVHYKELTHPAIS